MSAEGSTYWPLAEVRLGAGVLGERARLVRDVVLPYQWEALNDRIPGAERSGCMANLRIAAGEAQGTFHGMFWQDSDLAKWLEAASFRLEAEPDAVLAAEIADVIALLRKAQEADGYFNTFFQLVAPERKWTNLRDEHELYVMGHLIEAAVAHHAATGSRAFLEVAERMADLAGRLFGPGEGRRRGYCGHPEIELALVKLARATGGRRHVELAAYFIRERGRTPNFFEAEARARAEKEEPWHFYRDGLATLQADRPVLAQSEPVGHAVRQMYLLAAMIDVGRELGDAEMVAQAELIWARIAEAHLYVTGGVGAEAWGEKFGEPYDLPPERAYAETCAAIGVMMVARRLLDVAPRATVADGMERALYNTVLAGMGREGRTFFYVNPLEVVPAVAKRRHDCRLVKTQRVPWFGCACCPPNVARTLASLGHYLASRTAEGVWLHLYASAELRWTVGEMAVRLVVETDYPWDGAVKVTVWPARAVEFTLALRLPGWCRGPGVRVNGVVVDLAGATRDGYGELRREWEAGDEVALDLPMPVERERAQAAVGAVAGRVALQRGPLVYAVEEVDQGCGLAALVVPRDAQLAARWDGELLGGVMVIEGEIGRRRAGADDPLYTSEAAAVDAVRLRAVPYAWWANRGEGEMRVWLGEE